MKFTVWTESVKLSSLLSPEQMDIAKKNKNETSAFRVIIQNNHDTLDLFVDCWLDASVSDSVKLEPSDMLDFQDFSIDQIYLVAEWSNDQVRVLFS